MTHWPVGSPEHVLPRAHNVPLNSNSVSKRITMKPLPPLRAPYTFPKNTFYITEALGSCIIAMGQLEPSLLGGTG